MIGRARDRLLEAPRAYALVQTLTQLFGMERLHALFREFVDPGANDAVLELGCGTGQWAVSRHGRYLRTDVHDRYFPESPRPGVEFRRLDARDLSPLGGETFDLVYSFGLLHHLDHEGALASLREAGRVLRPGGRVVVFDAIAPTHRWNLAGRLLRNLDRGGFIRTREALLDLAASAGLVVVRSSACGWGPGLEGCFVEMVPRGHSRTAGSTA